MKNENKFKKKRILLFFLVLTLLPLISATSIGNQTITFSSISNSTIRFEQDTTLDQLIVDENATEIYNISTDNSIFTNINQTYNSTLRFYGIPSTWTIRNITDDTLIFTSSVGNDQYNVTFAPNVQIQVSSIPSPITISLTSPGDGTQDTDGIVKFTFTPTSGNTIDNCSLIYQNGVYTTSTAISNGVSNVIEVVQINSLHVLYSDDLQWSISCTDQFNNQASSSTRHLDTKEDAVGDPGGSGGGGGSIIPKNPTKMDLFYPEIWLINSSIKLIMKIYNKKDEVYEPSIIYLNFTIKGVELNKSEVDDLNQIIYTFDISEDAELGKQTIDIIVKDERTINQTIEFEIVERGEKEIIERILEKENRTIIFIVGGSIFFVILIAIFMEELYRKRKKKNQR